MSTTRTPLTFRTAMRRAVTRALLVTVAFGVAVTVGPAIGASSARMAPGHTAPDVSDVRIPAPVTPLQAHRGQCWTGDESPLAELPGAAVVRYAATGRVAYTRNPADVDAAFNEALASAGYGDTMSARLDPIALCK